MDHALGIGGNLLVATIRRQSVEAHMLAAGVEYEVLLHTGQSVVLPLLLRVPQHFRQRGIGQKLHNGIADPLKGSLVNMPPGDRVVVQNYTDIGLPHRLTHP